MPVPLYLGLDFGTSGARACVIAAPGEIEEMARVELDGLTPAHAAAAWQETLFSLIAGLPAGARKRIAALAVNGTSATVLGCDANFNPMAEPLLYHDARAAAEAAVIARAAGETHPAAMPASGLAKALWLRARHASVRCVLNQADWLAARLTGQASSDLHNALKMGADVASGTWPAWLDALIEPALLPRLARPGADIGAVRGDIAQRLGLAGDCRVRAGTTDSIAALLAALHGIEPAPGDAVTSLGSTLALKLVSARRVDDARFGVYSHWFGGLWLAGGASNAGGAVLRQHFGDAELRALSAAIDPARDLQRELGLDYYPLPRPGERFPISDPTLQPRLAPRPENRVDFLHGLLDGLARIEAAGYARLAELGASPARQVLGAGGGAQNGVYATLRQRRLGIPVRAAARGEACFGTARLAALGERLFPS